MPEESFFNRKIADYLESPLPSLIPRDTVITLENKLRRAITIVGPRRSGKTYVMFSMIGNLISSIPKERTLYLNFEDIDLNSLNIREVKNLIDHMYTTYEKHGSTLYLFLDEVQEIDDWEILVRNLIDESRFSVVITGSSSKLLSSEISTRLRGRTLTYTLTPLTFAEFLKFRNFRLDEKISTRGIIRIRNFLEEYMEYGGYPEVVLFKNERLRLLNEIMNLAIERDIIERYGYRNSHILKMLILNLSLSSIFSINKFYNYARNQSYQVGKDTLYSYVSSLEDNNIIFGIHNFRTSALKSQKTLAKYYFVDNGLLRISGNMDLFRKMENLVFMSLARTHGREKIFYYRTKSEREIDFLVNDDPVQLINVTYTMKNFETREREIKSLIEASRELGTSKLTIVTMDEEGEDENIRITPLWKFLLNLE